MGEQTHTKEHSAQSGEHHLKSKEHAAKLEQSRAEKAAEHLRADNRHEQEAARHEAREQAVSTADYGPKGDEKSPQAPPLQNKEAKLHSFNTTMHHVRRNLSKPERQFSKFIHQPAVEKTSEILGKTVARPSGIVGATIAAFMGLLSVYSVAKFAGFQLSGSEMPILLLAGFVTGLFIEWAFKAGRAIISRRSSQ